MKYDIKKVPRELLEEYAATMLCFKHANGSEIEANSDLGKQVVKAAEVPLRTRAEVDADIAKAVRDYARDFHPNTLNDRVYDSYMPGTKVLFSEHVAKLILEETSD
jgi:hypothetical protein